MKNKHAVFPIIMAGLAFLCFLFIAFNMAISVQPLWGKTMVLILPSLVLAFVGFLAFKGKLDARKTENLTVGLSIILVIAAFVYTIFLSVLMATTETTNVRYYTNAYKQIDHKDSVKGIFPKKLPDDAEAVSFRYHPQFLQGGELFELSYSTTADRLSDWADHLADKAEWIGSNEEWYQTHWGYGYEEAIRYQLYWEDGNHGETAYVLIDLTQNRITFFYEDW